MRTIPNFVLTGLFLCFVLITTAQAKIEGLAPQLGMVFTPDKENKIIVHATDDSESGSEKDFNSDFISEDDEPTEELTDASLPNNEGSEIQRARPPPRHIYVDYGRCYGRRYGRYKGRFRRYEVSCRCCPRTYGNQTSDTTGIEDKENKIIGHATDDCESGSDSKDDEPTEEPSEASLPNNEGSEIQRRPLPSSYVKLDCGTCVGLRYGQYHGQFGRYARSNNYPGTKTSDTGGRMSSSTEGVRAGGVF